VHQRVKVNEMPWFHGKIARERAEELLNAPNSPDGVFLVRESYNFPGDYTLCVCYQGKVEHYRVIAKKNTLTIDEEEKFENLTTLVDHYMKDADGLCTRLTEPKRNSDSKIAYHDVNYRVSYFVFVYLSSPPIAYNKSHIFYKSYLLHDKN